MLGLMLSTSNVDASESYVVFVRVTDVHLGASASAEQNWNLTLDYINVNVSDAKAVFITGDWIQDGSDPNVIVEFVNKTNQRLNDNIAWYLVHGDHDNENWTDPWVIDGKNVPRIVYPSLCYQYIPDENLPGMDYAVTFGKANLICLGVDYKALNYMYPE